MSKKIYYHTASWNYAEIKPEWVLTQKMRGKTTYEIKEAIAWDCATGRLHAIKKWITKTDINNIGFVNFFKNSIILTPNGISPHYEFWTKNPEEEEKWILKD